MADEPELWSQHDAAREYTRLARASEALFRAMGRLAPELSSPSATIAAATLARRLGAHATTWAELVPESVLLAEARESAPPVPDVAPEWDAVHEAIDSLRRDLTALLERTNEVADGAARRLARAVLEDLDAGRAGAPEGVRRPSNG
jgi:hypothetical protein